MERPTIIIEGVKYEMKKLVGRSWRTLGEFTENPPTYTDADFIEKHAAFIAKFYDVAAEEILEKMPLEEILPASIAIRTYVMNTLTEKIAVIEKNAATDKAEQLS